MAGKYLKTLTEVTRKPRHEVEDLSKLSITIDRADGLPSIVNKVELTDLSRGGCAVSCARHLIKDEPVWLTFTCSESDYTFNVPAMVRWTGPQNNQQFASGLQFEEELPMETLGELFLSGVLKVG